MYPLVTILTKDPFETIYDSILLRVDIDLMTEVTVLVVLVGIRAIWTEPEELVLTEFSS